MAYRTINLAYCWHKKTVADFAFLRRQLGMFEARQARTNLIWLLATCCPLPARCKLRYLQPDRTAPQRGPSMRGRPRCGKSVISSAESVRRGEPPRAAAGATHKTGR